MIALVIAVTMVVAGLAAISSFVPETEEVNCKKLLLRICFEIRFCLDVIQC